MPPVPAFFNTQQSLVIVIAIKNWTAINFLLTRNTRGTLIGRQAYEFRRGFVRSQGVTVENIARLMRLHHEKFLGELIKNMMWVVEEWMYNRPQGQIWVVNHEGTLTANIHRTADMAPAWDLWFDMGRITLPLPDNLNAEELAFSDFYNWCLRPVNIARVWEAPLRAINCSELVAWYEALHVRPLLPPGLINHQPMGLLTALRTVTRLMMQPTFIHIRMTLENQRHKTNFGRQSEWRESLYRFDEHTAQFHAELQHAVLNQHMFHRRRRNLWSFRSINEEDDQYRVHP
jgi:hypothetical protein